MDLVELRGFMSGMDTSVHLVVKTRLPKNTYGADFLLLSAGSHRASYLLLIENRHRPTIQTLPFGGFMKDILTMLLASFLVLVSLIVLLSAASTPDSSSWTFDNDHQRVSDVGLRFVFKR